MKQLSQLILFSNPQYYSAAMFYFTLHKAIPLCGSIIVKIGRFCFRAKFLEWRP
jgi:hypothetical protein